MARERLAIRTLVVVLVAALAVTLPNVSGNAAPVAEASVSTTRAVIDEPVVFTSASHDPDGTIVATTWEDWDGRQRSGNPLTMRMPLVSSPTVVTITMRVTDDAGATSALEIPIEIVPPTMWGRATAVDVAGSRFADTGDVSSQGNGERYDEAVADAQSGQLRIAALDGELRIVEYRSIATASVGFVHIPHPLGFFHITGLESEALATCSGTRRVATIGEFRLNDAPLVPPGEVAPNMVLTVGAATIVLNAQAEEPDGSLSVTAARILGPGAEPIELARSQAGVRDCPWGYVDPTLG